MFTPGLTLSLMARRAARPASVAALLLCLCFAPAVADAALAEDGIVPAFLIDRERRAAVGCDGAPATPPASLVPSENLRLLAGRIQSGQTTLDAAAAETGLKDAPVFFAVVEGATPQNAVANLKAAYCERIRSPQYTHVGVAGGNGRWAVLLAGGEPAGVPVYSPAVPPVDPSAAPSTSPAAVPMPGAAPAVSAPPARAREGVTPLFEAPPTPPAQAREGVTPLHEAPPAPPAGPAPGSEYGEAPDIGHKEPLLTGPDGRPLPSSYTPPADTGVRIAPEPSPVPSPAPISGRPGEAVQPGASPPAPAFAVSVVPPAASPVAEGASPAEPARDPTLPPNLPPNLPPEVGDPSPAAPVPPVYSDGRVKTAGEVEHSGPGAGAPGLQGAVEAGNADADLLRLVNDVRTRGHLCGRNLMPAVPPLRGNPTVGRAAAGHALDMRTRNYFSPVSPEGGRAGGRLTEAGYAWAVVAENIVSGANTPDVALQHWLGNESQCRNIMSPDYTEAGAGRAGDIRVLTLTAPLSNGTAPAP